MIRFWICRCPTDGRPGGNGSTGAFVGPDGIQDGDSGSVNEYQYYEFQAIDRPLTDRQMRELRGISTRAAITRTRFSNDYTYGDLKANPRDLLARYFDASLYFAHWHMVEVAFRFPGRSIDVRSLRRYRAGQSLDVRLVGPDVIVTMFAEHEDFNAEDDGRGWLSSLVPMRAEVASGDERALYLAWLLGVQQGEIDDRAAEPVRPDGLGTLSPALETFVDIAGLDRDLLTAAAEGGTSASTVPTAKVLERWLWELDGREKVALLSRAALGETGTGAELMRRFQQQARRRAAAVTLRTAAVLRARAEELAEQRRQIIIARESKERVRQEREQAAARERHLMTLAKRQPEAWRRVDALVATKRPGDYDAALTLLKDLCEIGERNGLSVEVATRIRGLREAHAKKTSFLARLKKAGF